MCVAGPECGDLIRYVCRGFMQQGEGSEKGTARPIFPAMAGSEEAMARPIYVRGRKAWVEIAPQHLFSCRWVRLGKSYCETHSYAAGKGLEKLHQKTIFFALVKVWKGLP